MPTPAEQRVRALVIAQDWVDRVKPREVGGNNRGKWVERFLRYVGLGPGYPWCAAFVSDVLGAAGFTKFKSAAVVLWRQWARDNKCWHKEPAIGALCLYVKPNGTGHIGIVESFTALSVTSIEGNTSSGESGSQRDGDGAFRRKRSRGLWHGYVYWWEA